MSLPPIPPSPAVFLDFDGTLVGFADAPDAIEVDPDLVDLLGRLRGRTDGALAVVTGRRVDEIDRFLKPLVLPVAGLHGIERRSHEDAEILSLPSSEQVRRLRDRLQTMSILGDGVNLEDKGSGLAVHYRLAPHAEADVKAALRDAVSDLEELHLIEGKMVVEAKRSDVNKGVAIADFMELPDFRNRIPVFLGDDVTDEDGFHLVDRLGGVTVKVGDGPSHARYRLANHQAVLDWLDRITKSETSIVP
ncbi:trehalose-phosphatase [Amorphus orientalis]|uniref:Trehalose 6-phosphate phosphatase n=1 Tax=Amorphus orientalis TaxID=649198 RepID=A0AAE3VS36_9HYPH|nr:trehalose-phosphatase [Amorphus orientalis]MDQ0316795.1 trehalose 6-phosphate phosphatase [Amorphus orientalis]